MSTPQRLSSALVFLISCSLALWLLPTPRVRAYRPPLGLTPTPTVTVGPGQPTPTPRLPTATPIPPSPTPAPPTATAPPATATSIPDTPTPIATSSPPNDDDDSPSHTSQVQLLNCDLVCNETPGLGGSLAAMPSVMAPVQLVHAGSGYRIDSCLSDAGSTTINAPYSGRWDVYLTGTPYSGGAEGLPDTNTNLGNLAGQLPIHLGQITIGDGSLQTLACPIQCVGILQTTNSLTTPKTLPTTGQGQPTSLWLNGQPLILGGLLMLVGFWILLLWLLNYQAHALEPIRTMRSEVERQERIRRIR